MEATVPISNANQILAATGAARPDERAALPSTLLLLAWILSGALMIATLGVLGISRTQEARVLEVAREMIGTGWDGWVIPHANAEIRIHKPPLAYWVAAAPFEVFGVSDFTGRIPFAIATWLTVGLTYLFGKQLFNPRAGLYAAAMLFASVLFSHFTRRAETDTLILLFVTAAIYCIWRSTLEPREAVVGSRQTAWLYALGVLLGLTIMAKGPPALFVLLFWIGWSLWIGRLDTLKRFFTRGAFIPMILIAVPWYAYIVAELGWGRFNREISNVVEGTDHFKWFWTYFADLLVATAPWCAMVLHAIVEAGVRFRVDRRTHVPLLWMTVVFVPLCCMGNKQTHYLLPMLPPLMLIAGWGADVAARETRANGFGRAYRVIALATLIVGAGGAVGLIILPRVAFGSIEPVHVLTAIVTAITAVGGLVLFRKRGLSAALTWSLLWSGVMVSLLTSVYHATMREDDLRGSVADMQRRFPNAEYCVYQGPANLAMCFYLNDTIPTFADDASFKGYAAKTPNLVPMRIAKPKDPIDPPPPGYHATFEMENDNRRYTFYEPGATTMPSTVATSQVSE